MTAASIVEHIDHFQHRVIQDALLDAEAGYWLRRAEVFEWAKSRPDDYHGESTQAERDERDRRLQVTADACRARARLALGRVA